MENFQKIIILKSCGKISLVLFACFLFIQIGSIGVTNAILRDSDKLADNYFMAGIWESDLSLNALTALASPNNQTTPLEEPALAAVPPVIGEDPVPETTEPETENPAPAETVDSSMPADMIAKESPDEKPDLSEAVPDEIDTSVVIVENADAEQSEPEVTNIPEPEIDVEIVE